MHFDSYSSNTSKNRHNNKLDTNVKIGIVVIGAILLGLIVYFIAKLIFSPRVNKPHTDADTSGTTVELSIKNEKVQELYTYVKYKTNVDNDIFVRNNSVEYKNFSNYDKYYYMSQLIKETDLTELKSTNNTTKSYTIDASKVSEYMKKLFGPKVKFNKNIETTIYLPFTKEDKNTGTIKYDSSTSKYIITLNSNTKQLTKTNTYITDLSKAVKYDKKLIIEEKIIYTDIKVNNKYNVNIYKDYYHTMLLDKKENIGKDDLDNLIDNYLDDAPIITYVFALDDNDDYYFESSRIDN